MWINSRFSSRISLLIKSYILIQETAKKNMTGNKKNKNIKDIKAGIYLIYKKNKIEKLTIRKGME